MTDRNVCPTGRRGMTLVEILTVLAIITTLLLIGWGVMYKIIDPASRESAQNQISAALNGARNRAMAMQKTCGIMFFLDPRSDRVSIANVVDGGVIADDQNVIDYITITNGAERPDVILDLLDTEFTALPPGVLVQTLNSAVMFNNVPMNDQYIGFNRMLVAANTWSIPIGGVILFDQRGELACRRWALRYKYATGGATPMVKLLCYDRASNDPAITGVTLTVGEMQMYFPAADVNTGRKAEFLPRSTMGVAVMDRQTYLLAAQRFITSGVDLLSDDQFNSSLRALTAGEKSKEQWISTNARIFMVGRYNGTLIDTRFTP